MKKLLLILFSFFTFSCTDQSAVSDSLERLIEESKQTQEKLATKIHRTIAEHGVTSDSMLVARDSILSISQEAKIEIENSNSEEAIQNIVDEWNSRIQEVFRTKEYAGVNNEIEFSLNKLFALLEINNRTNNILREVNKHATPAMRYEHFKLLIEPERHSVLLGQKLKGKVYLTVTSSHTPNVVSITVNDKEVEFDNEGTGLFEVKPDKRGKFLLEAKATGRPGSVHNFMDVENSITVDVR